MINTHGMLAANQQQMRQAWPFLSEEPPVLLDWLPWSHTFGGNHDSNMVLANGGTLWIDDGRPAPALIGRTVAHLAEARPTIYLNVPAGYAALLPHLERDDAAARAFFERLRLGFFAAAALPQQLWDRLTSLAERHGSSMQMTTSWGMTETSPAATTAHFPITRSDCLGVPLPGVELALVPSGDKTELRVRGPNITPGYHRRPDLAETSFDQHGYLRTGDAVAMIDEDDPSAGLVFRGRIAEDFKLSSGTFVSVGTLRPRLLSASNGLLTDAVLCGENGESVSAMVWLHPDHAHRCLDGVPDDGLRADLEATLERLAAEGGCASQRVDRLLVLTEPAGLDTGEITDKGYVEPTGGARAAGRRGHRPRRRPTARPRRIAPSAPTDLTNLPTARTRVTARRVDTPIRHCHGRGVPRRPGPCGSLGSRRQLHPAPEREPTGSPRPWPGSTVDESDTMTITDSTRLLLDLEPVVAENLDRHLEVAKDWMPHEYVPWSLGRDFADLGGRGLGPRAVVVVAGGPDRARGQPPDRGQPAQLPP